MKEYKLGSNPKLAIVCPVCDRGVGISVVRSYLRSIREHLGTSVEIWLGVQELDKSECEEVFNYFKVSGWIYWEERKTPYVVRAALLPFIEKGSSADFIVFHDDDMLMIESTNYLGAMEKAKEKSSGIVSCNWGRTLELTKKKKTTEEFVKQSLVNMSGGMVFRKELYPIIVADPKDWFYDDIQYGLNCYIEGYENYRYFGSLAVHRIVTKGGLLTSHRTMDFIPIDEKYVTRRKCSDVYENKDHNYYMPMPKDLTDYSKQIHSEKKKGLV